MVEAATKRRRGAKVVEGVIDGGGVSNWKRMVNQMCGGRLLVVIFSGSV